MRVSFDFLSTPIEIKSNSINVLVIENKALFRKVLTSFINGSPEEDNIVFSYNYEPFKFKGNVFVIDNYFSFDFSAAFIKKLYEDISRFCVDYMYDFTVRMKGNINDYFDTIIQNYDFDFSCKSEIELTDLFKIMNLKPDLMKESAAETLIDFMLLIQKYTPQKCFVLFNLHLFFNTIELELLYEQILKSNINVLLLEGVAHNRIVNENITIIDEDICEIVEMF